MVSFIIHREKARCMAMPPSHSLESSHGGIIASFRIHETRIWTRRELLKLIEPDLETSEFSSRV